jgi:hypothetical protein
MKKTILILIFLLCGICGVLAQEKGAYHAGFDTQFSLYGNSGLKPVEMGIDLGYNFTNWLDGSIRFEESIGLFEANHVKSYALSEAIGGVVGFNVFKSNAGTLTLKTSIGGTVGHNDWRYLFYSGGVYFNFGNTKIKPSLGFGVRYYDSKTDAVNNYLRFYCSLGFRFN